MSAGLPFAGIDGCRGGWILARWDGGARLHLSRIASIAELFDAPDPPLQAAIDIPIGLPARVGLGGRPPEQALRPKLGERQSAVFSVPSRAAVMAGLGPGDDGERYRAACATARVTSDPPRAVSRQCFGLFPKIGEVDRLLRNRPELIPRLVECHPEAAFWVMNGERPLEEPKKVKNRPHPPGLELRRTLLGGFKIPQTILTEHTSRALGAGLDDLLDACACAVTAKRVLDGNALRFPPVPGYDDMGLPVVINA